MTTPKNDDVKALNETIKRLMLENAKWRQLVEEAEAEIRRRAPNADGLTIKGAIKTILDDRDNNLKKIDFYRDQMKKILKLLIEERAPDAKKELNVFLFNDKK